MLRLERELPTSRGLSMSTSFLGMELVGLAAFLPAAHVCAWLAAGLAEAQCRANKYACMQKCPQKMLDPMRTPRTKAPE